MRTTTLCRLTALICAAAWPARAQGPLPPHAWLFGSWIGGLFPAPVTLTAQECLAQPVVIFTRDLVMRATFVSDTMVQRRVDTARATADGAEFRFLGPVEAANEGGGLFGPASRPEDVGFGCENPDVLHVERISENEIKFPHCGDFPYPLIRCPSR
jgi:hypothetical protein